MIDFDKKTVVVLGAARQGLALAKYAAHHGAHIIITDQRSYEQLADAMKSVSDLNPEWVCGGHPLALLDRADMLCVTAGADLRIPFLQEAIRRNIPIRNDAAIFFHEVKNNGEMKIYEDKIRYVIEINIKVGLHDHIYTKTYKEDDNDDYGCYIKLNGTVKKIAGESLFYYTKNKIMKYIKNLAEKQNNANFINNN